MLSAQKIREIQDKLSKNRNQRLTAVFTVLANQNRLEILKLIIKYPGLCVTDLSKIFEVSVSAISHQAKILEIYGLIRKERKGKIICYRLNNDEPLTKYLIKIFKSKLKTGKKP